MTADGRLLLSGFYTTDIPMLQDKAVQLGMRMVSQYQEGEWACLVFRAEI
jgi:ribosomal protein L11 methyltransferase